MNFVLEHIALPAVDAAALRDWYKSKLGADCIAPNGEAPPYFIKLPGASTTFELYPATGSVPHGRTPRAPIPPGQADVAAFQDGDGRREGP